MDWNTLTKTRCKEQPAPDRTTEVPFPVVNYYCTRTMGAWVRLTTFGGKGSRTILFPLRRSDSNFSILVVPVAGESSSGLE